ncbi:hypothetical protein [Occultella kanbiaonis]|uniref:hypothetical protein n=1 Tax=Occultella kanbiaonis TaxID=2675754 RepID=UPI0012B899FF|nr:hypothetical protein [Occultella kanbiaonis]
MSANRSKVAARERARQRRLELDAERARRDEQIEQAAAEFFQAQGAHREAAARMGAAAATLAALGESSQRIQLLLEVSAADLRRLRQISRESGASDPRPRPERPDTPTNTPKRPEHGPRT